MQDLSGTFLVDAAPAAGIEVSLLGADGAVLAATRSDAAGGFAFPAAQRARARSVVAKVYEPVLGAVAAPVSQTGAGLALRLDTSAARALTLVLALPAGAPAVPWFDLSLTPTALTGLSPAELGALTLDGAGPARRDAYRHVRVHERRVTVRVLPGTYDVRVEHFVDGPKAPPSASWLGARATARDGSVVEADLGYLPLEVRDDTELVVELRASSAR